MRKNKKGFTLVELVIVIAVIAILSAVLLPTFSGVIESAKLSSADSRASNAFKGYYGNVVTVSTEDEIDSAADLEGYIIIVENGTGISDYLYYVKDGKLTSAEKVNHNYNPDAELNETNHGHSLHNERVASDDNEIEVTLPSGAEVKLGELKLEIEYENEQAKVFIFYGTSAQGFNQIGDRVTTNRG